MNSEFPENNSKKYLNSKDFQDQKRNLTFIGWEKKANEDRPARGNAPATTWKQTLKYCLRYSYPQWATDEAGLQRLDKSGQPFENSNYDPRYPQGYTIVYNFEEGSFDSGSLPLWKAFCSVKAKSGNRLVIGKTGKDKETVWTVKKLTSEGSLSQASNEEVPSIDRDEPEWMKEVGE